MTEQPHTQQPNKHEIDAGDDELRLLERALHHTSSEQTPNHDAALSMDDAVTRLHQAGRTLDDEPIDEFPRYLTPAERIQRHSLVELQYATNGATPWNGGKYLNPRDRDILRDWVGREDIDRASPVGQEVKGWIGQNRLAGARYDLYTKYLSELRAIRREQAKDPYVRGRLEQALTAPDADARKTLYLEAMSFSPAISGQTLEYLNERGARLFTKEQIVRAVSNPTEFQQALTQAIVRNPDLVVESLDVIATVVPADTIRNAFDTILREGVFVSLQNNSSLSKLLEYYPKEQRPQVVERMLTTYGYKRAVLDQLVGAGWQSILELDADARQALARKIFQSDNFVPSKDALEKGITQGFWTIAEVEAKLLADLAKPKIDRTVFDAVSMTSLSPEVRSQIYNTRLNTMMREEEMPYSWDLGSLESEDVERLIVKKLTDDPIRALRNLNDQITAHLPPEALRELYLRYITEADDNHDLYEAIFKTNALTEDEKRQYLRSIQAEHPGQFVTIVQWRRDAVEQLLGVDATKELLKHALHSATFREVAWTIQSDSSIIEDDDELRQFVSEGIRNGEVSFIESIHTTIDARLKQLFTTTELEQLIEVGIRSLVANAKVIDQGKYITVIEELFGAEKARALFDTVWRARPVDAVNDMLRFAYLYDANTMDEYIQLLAATRAGRETILQYRELGRFASPDTMRQIIFTLCDGSLDDRLITACSSFELYMSHEEVARLVAQIAERNPAIVLAHKEDFEPYGVETQESVVIERALADESAMATLGGYLQPTLTRIQKATNESQKTRLIRDAFKAYRSIAALDQGGFTDDFRAMRSRAALVGPGDRLALESYLALREFTPEVTTDDITSIDALHKVTLAATAHALDAAPLSVEQVDTLAAMMEGSNSLSVYTVAMRESEPHRALLRSMIQSMAGGEASYQQWRLGGDMPFESLRESGLLPRNLTADQFAEWQQEEKSGSEEVFTLEAREAAREIGEVLESSRAELALPTAAFSPDDQPAAVADQIARQISEFGAELGTVHRELQTLRALPDQTLTAQQISDLEDRARVLSDQRQSLQVQHDTLLLAHLSPDSVVAGAIMHEGGKKGTPLASVLRRFGKNLGPEREYVVNRVRSVLDDYRSQAGETKQITVRDTINPRLTMEIGDTPVESCQHYRDGAFNECLVGYTEPNTRLLILSGANGRPIARSILRLLEDSDGEPVLHMETVYSAQASDAVVKAMQLHAISKAEKLGVSVYASTRSQNEQGQLVASTRVAGVRYQSTAQALSAKRARAPWVYVDSLGERVEGGAYTIKSLVEMRRA